MLGSLAGYAVYVAATGAGLPADLAPDRTGRAPPRRPRVGRGGRSRGHARCHRVHVPQHHVARSARAGFGPSSVPSSAAWSSPRLGLASAYSLTFGEEQISEILVHHGGTVAFFALAAGAKLLGTSVTLSAEWRGGFIIPLFFIGACLGRAFHVIAPGTNEAVMIAGFMASTNVGVTKTPIGSTLVVSEMAGFRLLPTTLLATFVAYILTSEVGLIHTQRERDVVGEEAR